MRSFTTLLALPLLAAPAVRAQTPGDCAQGMAEGVLDQSDVRAALFNTGALFYGNTTVSGDGYLVPQASGHSPIYAASLWVGGMMGGELRTAAATYTRFEFWPGPLDDGAALPDPADCSAFDRIWVVSVSDVEHYEATGEATADLAAWPVGLGAPAVDADGDPVVPQSRDQVIDLAAGERPEIYGTQMAFWVMNDVGGEHEQTLSLPIGLEVQVLASVIESADEAFDQATFYRYRLINRNSAPLTSAYVTLYVDTDLGSASDDYSGSDSTRALAFTYNGDDNDPVYGTPPPAVGLDLLTGAASAVILTNDGGGPTTDPVTQEEYYSMMQGLWKDGTPMTASGSGYQTTGPVTVWGFPGDPEASECWSKVNPCDGLPPLPADDHRFVLTSPSFSLEPGEERVFDLAILFSTGTDHLNSVTALKAASDLVQAAYDDGALFPTTVANEPGVGQPAGHALLPAYPNPFRSQTTVSFEVPQAGPIRLAVYDLLGREAAVLYDGPAAAGRHEAVLEGRGLASGVYVVVLEVEGAVRERQKVLLVR